jgi:hypothetical protein
MEMKDKRVIIAEMKKLIVALDDFEGDTKLCSNCGKIHPLDTTFCDLCGNRIKPPKRPEVKVKRILNE